QNTPYADTLVPLTITPVSAVLTVHPTPEPWSARQAQMWSTMTSLLLTTRLVVAEPAPPPPMRKKTSFIDAGLRAWPAAEPSGPIWSSIGDVVGPASKSKPASLTPSTS